MNRLGRGYSFEALRAKILFTEGAHKKTLAKPKFERRREVETLTSYDLPPGRLARSFAIPMNTRWRAEEPQRQYEQPKNFGPDINTLIELLQSGRL